MIQSLIIVLKPFPFESEIIKSVKHAFVPTISRVVKIPFPAGIVKPEKLKPNTVLLPVETVNPAFWASPPEALLTSTFST